MWKYESLSHVQLCGIMDCNLPGFSVHGILQARILEWVATSFSQEIFLTQKLYLGLLHYWQIFFTVWATKAHNCHNLLFLLGDLL